jgi:hypothetical protein
MRSDCPGRNLMSRAMPFRLFKKPSTATRSFIGVMPAGTACCSGTAVLVDPCSLAALSAGCDPCRHPASATSRQAVRTVLRTYSGVQAW